MSLRRHLLLAASATVLLPLQAGAQADKPAIKILMGLPPSGGTDSIARYIAERLREQLGQPVVIESRVGVGGRLAADVLMTAPPDGLTYMIAPNATPTFQTLVFGPQLKWHFWRDFAPVAGLVSYPLGMAVNADLGINTVAEFVRWAKAYPQKASFGTPGTGGQNHFLGVQFAKVAGIELAVTPYRGTPPMITDLLGGHVPAGISLMDELMKHHKTGKLRVLGIFSDRRSELMPEIPTFAEQGFKVSSGDGWTAMWAPEKSTPSRARPHAGSAAKGAGPTDCARAPDDQAVGHAEFPQRRRHGPLAARGTGHLGAHHQRLRFQARITRALC